MKPLIFFLCLAFVSGCKKEESSPLGNTDNPAELIPVVFEQIRRIFSFPQLLGMTPSGYLFVGYVNDALFRSDVSTAVSDKPLLQPITYGLNQNYPNPFNPSTTIEYEVPHRSEVGIKIYNSVGQLVKSLLSGETKEPGNYSVKWDGSDDRGNRVSSGAYFYSL